MPTAVNLQRYPLTLGLPHTNLSGFSETALLMHAGNFQWSTLSSALKCPLSDLRTPTGAQIYPTFFYVELKMPGSRVLSEFKLDDELLFLVRLRHYKGMALDSSVCFDRSGENIEKGPLLRFANVFIARVTGNEHLKITRPENVSFDHLEEMPAEDYLYPLVRQAETDRTFGTIPSDWKSLDKKPKFAVNYIINPQRDTNGAGLVYFANYVAFMDQAEQCALEKNCTRKWPLEALWKRSPSRRRIAYYGNIGLDDTLRIEVQIFSDNASQIGTRLSVFRLSDSQLVCLSEAVKQIPSEGKS